MPRGVPNPDREVILRELMEKCGITHSSATVYYSRCLKDGINPREWNCKFSSFKKPLKLPSVDIKDKDGNKFKQRTVLTIEEQKGLLVRMILNLETKDTDRLKALDMYNEISGNKQEVMNGEYKLIIKDVKE